MPQITVTISQSSTEVSNKSFKCESDKLPDLLKSLAQAKDDTNAELTKLVEASKSKSSANGSQQKDTEMDDEDSSEDDDENDVQSSNKKIKT